MTQCLSSETEIPYNFSVGNSYIAEELNTFLPPPAPAPASTLAPAAITTQALGNDKLDRMGPRQGPFPAPRDVVAPSKAVRICTPFEFPMAKVGGPSHALTFEVEEANTNERRSFLFCYCLYSRFRSSDLWLFEVTPPVPPH